MGITRFIAIAALVALVVTSCACGRKRKSSRRSKRNHATCRPRLLMRYKMTVTTLWTKESFPKMFPTYRPHAHWSTLIGRTHGPSHQMWQKGSNASQAVRKFVEEEDSELLELETGQGYNNVLDLFTAPAVDTSAGQTSSVFMVDGGHSLVSFIMKIVPSPDWFIGLSSVDLCHRGRWKKNVRVNLQPFDAGTDQGLTFTSPNWPHDPQVPVFGITSSKPNHPASSFFYPEYKKLPRLAYVEVQLLSEYRLRRTIKNLNEVVTTTTTTTTTTPAYARDSLFSVGLGGGGTARRQINFVGSGPTRGNQATTLLSGTRRGPGGSARGPGGASDELIPRASARIGSFGKKDNGRSQRFGHGQGKDQRSRGSSGPTSSPGSDASRQMSGQAKSPERSTRPSSMNEKYVDCLVSDWSDWSPCSKTCGYGNRQRSREVTQMPGSHGNVCPPLSQNTVCGSMSTCQWRHFSLFKNPPRPRGRRQRRRKKPA